MENKDRGVVIVGAGKVGKESLKHIAVHTGETPLLVTNAEDLAKLKKDVSTEEIEIQPPVFETEEEAIEFMRQTEPIPLSKLPKMPDTVRTINDYLREYELIQRKESKLSGSQRIVVKNIIHHELRTGNLILKPTK